MKPREGRVTLAKGGARPIGDRILAYELGRQAALAGRGLQCPDWMMKMPAIRHMFLEGWSDARPHGKGATDGPAR